MDRRRGGAGPSLRACPAGSANPFSGMRVAGVIVVTSGGLGRHGAGEEVEGERQERHQSTEDRQQPGRCGRLRPGDLLRKGNYEIAPFLETVFLSRDFYSDASMGGLIQSPVVLAVSTYKKLGQTAVPGVPDFNVATRTLGQQLMAPPTVAVAA